MSEAKEGEFTLVYNGKDKAHPVALTKEQHELTQALVSSLPGEIKVLKFMKVEYCR